MGITMSTSGLKRPPLIPEDSIESQNITQEKNVTKDRSDNQGSTTTLSTSRKTTRKAIKKRSEVWEHFTKFEDENGNKRAKCNYCPNSYSSDPLKNGTTSLRNHMANCKANPHNKEMKQALLNFKKGEDGKKNELCSWKFDAKAVRKALAYFIILDALPFKSVEGKGFKHFISIACGPQFDATSRFTLQRDCFDIYLEENFFLKSILRESSQTVCLTTDTWSSIQRINYMCLTAHWIDNNWKLRKRILNFCPISSHRGEDLGKALERCLVDWGVNNIFSITVDNASSNDVMISYLKKRLNQWGGSMLQGKLLHMRCIAHIINLVVGDGLKELGPSVARVRGAIRYVRQSPARFNKFKECVEYEKIEYKCGLCLDVSTRWNSTYLMLDAAQKYERAFERFEIEDRYYRSELEKGDGVPMEVDWENVRSLCIFLEKFYTLTLQVSGSSYVTSNVHLHEIGKVVNNLNKMQLCDDVHLSIMAKKMKEKYEKYWGNWEKMNMLTYIAVVLDPRWKLSFVEFTLEDLYKPNHEARIQHVKDILHSLFNEYNVKYGDSSVKASATTSTIASEEDDGDFRTRFKRMRATIGCEVSKSELDKYLNESLEVDGPAFEILDYWKVNNSRFPILSKMARDVLAVPISTVTSESTFSMGGRILDTFRSSLTPRIAQCLLCTEDWIRAKFNDVAKINIEEDLENLEKLEMDLSKMALDPINDL